MHQTTPNRVWCVGEQLVAIDADQDTVAASIPVGCWPQTICYSSKSRKIYVGYRFGFAGYVTVIDPATSTVVRTIRVPHFGPVLCYNAAADKIYTGGYADSELSVISCRSDSVVASIGIGNGGSGLICSNPMDKKVYFTNSVSGCVEVIDASRDSVVNSLWIGSHPDYMCYNMANQCLYVDFTGHDSLGWIAVVDSSESVVTTMDTRNTGEHMVINPVTNALYCVDDIGGGVTLIDCDSNKVLRDWWFVQQQFGVAVNTRDSKVYLTGYGRGNLWVLDGATNRLDSIWLGDPIGACHVFYDSVSNHIYCASNRVYVVDCASGTVLDTFPQTMLTYDWQDAFAFDPPSSRVFGLDYCKSQVFVIHDTSTVGVAEPVQHAGVRPVMPTFVHGKLELPEDAAIPCGSPIALVDITGRKVADLRPGPNDVRTLAPGVYFVREEPQAVNSKPQAVRKVIITE
jgi:YVTN family beta-propeller protein